MTARAIPIGIIEPQRLFAPFLTQLLSEAGFSVVATLESLSLDEIGRHEPKVVFVDIDFLDVEPIAAIRQLRSVVPDATICVYTGNVDEGWAAACSRAGGNCLISKSAAPAEIVSGIQRALRVGVYVDWRFDNENDSADGAG